MRKKIINNRWQYFILIFLIVVHVSLFYALWPLRQLQQVVAISLGITYFIWGLFTNDLNKRVVMEYLVVSLLASSMLYLIAS
jgi:hypothetical protein